MKLKRFVPLLGVLLAILTAATLTSCSILPQTEPTTIYQLPPASIVAGTEKPLAGSLCIARPQASGLMEGARIAVVPTPNTISAYPDVRWQSPAPTLWQEYLLDAFQRGERLAAIISDQQDLFADYRLDSTLHSFQVEYHSGSAQVIIVMDFSLADKATKRIIRSRRFTAQLPVDGEQVPQVVATFGRAVDAIAHELTTWAYQAIEKHTYLQTL